jgi:acyl dehydratase
LETFIRACWQSFFKRVIDVITDVIETKALHRIGGGVVVIDLDVKNQNDETVMKGKWTALMASRPQ